ncbi:ribosome biogenesis GTPase Der [Endozoicomonas sp. OPT23]|uniref:ribosome biogenesis GTPase Der n=1 Tax=Endozoicomonas sp. OPT23 TaxID=2072845 RepID=UPI00129B51BD|nr:ribosome biogenesis GTPase Der [Endozoicomonas sp. OPT23]MRI35064.1 ribosome biogenesis GTPase Der [Endozoicomonas sp. OPT23]
MVPVIALVGRPNVGKSTLFNRLTRSRDALVANVAGLTRDRKYGEGKMGERPYIVVDTGGISGDEEGIDSAMAEQSLAAIDEADIVLFMVDARAGMTAADEMIADHLRKQGKSYKLVLNKTDTVDADQAEADFARLGFGEAYHVAAVHGRGVKQMIDDVLERVTGLTTEEFEAQAEEEEEDDKTRGIKIGIVGRPNVGKSTLVNRLLGEERVVVYDQAGTTRDSVYIPYERFGQDYTLIDTAGVRRRGKVHEIAEKFSVVKTLQAIEDANVVVLVLDAREGIVEQDLHLLGFILESGRAVVLAVNKWDGMKEEERKKVKEELSRRLDFINFARIHMISAMHGTNVGHLYESIDEAYECATKKLSTNQLTRILEDAVKVHQPPLVRNRRIKLRYCHAGAMNPPTIIIHGNQTEEVPASYKRYLENTFRKVLKIMGTPIRIEFRSSENPFADRKAVHKKSHGDGERKVTHKRRTIELKSKKKDSPNKKKQKARR